VKETLSAHEAHMRNALLRALRMKRTSVSVDRADIIVKNWVIGKTKGEATILEGRLTRNIWSGDITISYRRFNVKI